MYLGWQKKEELSRPNCAWLYKLWEIWLLDIHHIKKNNFELFLLAGDSPLSTYREIKSGMVGRPVKDARSVPCRRKMYFSHIDLSYEMCWGSCIDLSFSDTRRKLLCTRESISSCDSGLASSFEEDKGLFTFTEVVLVLGKGCNTLSARYFKSTLMSNLTIKAVCPLLIVPPVRWTVRWTVDLHEESHQSHAWYSGIEGRLGHHY